LIIDNCIILALSGVSSQSGLPNWISKCEIENYQALNTISRIRNANLNPAQLIFLSFIRKLFLQPGSGRKEAALFRGLGDSVNKKLSDKIIKIMIREGLVDTAKGYEGIIYLPKRENTQRLKRIVDQLALSRINYGLIYPILRNNQHDSSLLSQVFPLSMPSSYLRR
jgi:hypothetical protein